jgi:hypothetical protein
MPMSDLQLISDIPAALIDVREVPRGDIATLAHATKSGAGIKWKHCTQAWRGTWLRSAAAGEKQ